MTPWFKELMSELHLRRQVLLGALIWTLAISAFLGIGVHYSHRENRDLALTRARENFQKEVLISLMITQPGGGYALPGRATLAEAPVRRGITSGEMPFARGIPAHLSQISHDLGLEEPLLKGHMTSLNPLRPENAADPWERKALQELHAGQREYWEVVTSAGRPELRFMGALVTLEGCLGCHAAQGHKVGDIRGGISFTLPLSQDSRVLGGSHNLAMSAGLGIVWMIGILVILLAGRWNLNRREERRRANEALRESEEQLRTIFETSEAGIILVSPDGNIRFANHRMAEMFGTTHLDLIDTPYTDHLHASDLQDGRERLHQIFDEEMRSIYWDRRYVRVDGTDFWGHISGRRLDNPDGSPKAFVAVITDITERKDHERRLEHLAHFDSLTSLPNRVLLADRLRQDIAQAHRRGQCLAVVYLDLDNFKPINDHHGHEIGDQLLMTLATRMKQALREGDTLARLGGDEFVAVLLDLSGVESSVPILTRLIAAVNQPACINNTALHISASVGVTFYPQEEEVGAEQLLRQADQAMYQAKLAGKNRYHIFDAELDRNVRGHHESLDRIRQALAEREFIVHYQPKVNMRTGAVIGAEALIRWQHPERGLLLPAAFLPVVEDHAVAIEIDEWVIDTVLAQMALWRKAGCNIPVSANVGARQLQQADFVQRLRARLAAHPGVGPGDLELEVLETSALKDMAQAAQVIKECRDIGVMFALDDFGTGYSSLTYLRQLPVAQIKIDKSFVLGMHDHPDDMAILEGVVGLAIAFRRKVIAEGVQTMEQGKMLLRLGCELGQGFGIARPMPAQELPGWSEAWRPDPAWVDCPPASRDELRRLFASLEYPSI
ncbi:MAG: EAL domain-containing protein [Geothrix sp.]|nr:EAL domain-containing protein [Geothrix sp.]